jgi:hypothetical protein
LERHVQTLNSRATAPGRVDGRQASEIAHRHAAVSGRPVHVLLALVALLLGAAPGQSSPVTEYQLKAAFLYNFAKFVEWPSSGFASASSPLQICVLGQDPFGQELHAITQDKTVNGRRLEVQDVADAQQARSCHILFIAASEKTRVEVILNSLRGTSVLTIGDTKGFTDRGGMINFVLDNDRVKFEVNQKAAEEAGLKISSKLLGVARLVVR